jgi:hypothetical protein
MSDISRFLRQIHHCGKLCLGGHFPFDSGDTPKFPNLTAGFAA